MKKTKILAPLLALVLILSSFSALSLTTYAEDATGENTPTVYEVDTLEEFKNALNYSNVEIHVMDDINLNEGPKSTPLGTLKNGIKIYGNGHSLYNGLIQNSGGYSRGLFYADENAHFEIYDLNFGTDEYPIVFENTAAMSWANLAGIVGSCNVSFVMENVNLYADTASTSIGGTGAFAGFFGNLTLTGNSYFNNCHLYGDLTNSTSAQGFYRVGGFVGVPKGAHTLTFNGCTSNADLTGGADIGGFIALMEDATNATAVVMNHCVNNSTIVSRGHSNSTNGRVGGFIGSIGAAATSSLTLNNCVNNGTISSKSAGFGGFAGQLIKGIVTLNGCVNNAAIGANNVSYWTGGLIGIVDTNGTANISNSANLANLNASSSVGGIIGEVRGTANISNCVNAGNISTNTTNGVGSHMIGLYIATATKSVTSSFACATVTAVTVTEFDTVTTLGSLDEVAAKMRDMKLGYYTVQDGKVALDTRVPQIVGAQTSTNVGETFNVRFIAVLKNSDLSQYSKVGFKVEADCNNGQTLDATKDSSVVFKSLNASVDGAMKTYESYELGGDYIIAIVWNGVPANNGNGTNYTVNFTVTPYAVSLDGETTYTGLSYDFTYINGAKPAAN